MGSRGLDGEVVLLLEALLKGAEFVFFLLEGIFEQGELGFASKVVKDEV